MSFRTWQSIGQIFRLAAIFLLFGSAQLITASTPTAATPSASNVTVTVGDMDCGVSGMNSGWGYGGAPCSIAYQATVTDATPGAQICYSVQLSAFSGNTSGCTTSG